MMFAETSPHYCPECPTVLSKKGRNNSPTLFLERESYSGLPIDFARCAECGHLFEISYSVNINKVVKVT